MTYSFQIAKVTFKLTEGHFQSFHSIGNIWFLLVFYFNYVSILHCFRERGSLYLSLKVKSKASVLTTKSGVMQKVTLHFGLGIKSKSKPSAKTKIWDKLNLSNPVLSQMTVMQLDR